MADGIIPSNRWFPTSLVARAAWFLNFNTQCQTTGTVYGLTTGEVDAIKDDNLVMQFLAGAFVTLDAYLDSLRSYRDGITQGSIGQPIPLFPPSPSLALPENVPTGIFERVMNAAERIKGAADYTQSVGELYGIVGTTPEAPIAGDVKPTIKLEAAAHDHMFSTVVAGREESDAWVVWIRPDGTSDWQMAATATGKSVDITYDPGSATGAVQLEVYVQLRRNNANYGQPSEIGLVTVNP